MYKSGEQMVPLAHPEAPKTEAARMAEACELAPEDVLLVFGWGNGYHLKALLERLSPQNRMFVFEPCPEIWQASLECDDFSSLLLDDRVFLFLGSDITRARAFLMNHLGHFLAGKHQLLVHQPSLYISREKFSAIQELLKELAETGPVLIRSRGLYTHDHYQARLRNLKNYLASPGVRPLKNCLKGQAVVLACSGPSLSVAVEHIKRYKSRLPMIAVSSAAYYLTHHGVVPEAVAITDFHHASLKYFSSLVQTPTGRSVLVADARANHESG